MNIPELLRRSAEYLKFCGVAEAGAEAGLLLAHVLRTTREKIYLDRDLPIGQAELKQFLGLLKERGKRVPLAYLTNNREFMSLNFYVDQNVLIPRRETELLVEKTLRLGREYFSGRTNIMDLCTGSGAIAVSLAYYWPEAAVTATDIAKEALAVAARNAERTKVKIDLRLGDLFQPVTGEKFHIIVVNPPYVSEEEYPDCSQEVKKEPVQALLAGRDGLDYYRRIAEEAEEHLRLRGLILMEIGYSQGQKVAELFAGKGYATEISRDYAGLDRIVTARKE